MSADFEYKLGKYAEVIVKSGLNLQPGQRLVIGVPLYELMGVPIELAPLVRKITSEAYKAGARYVDVMWNDDQLTLTRFQEGDGTALGEFPIWKAEAARKAAEEGNAILILYAKDPELLSGQDTDLVAAWRRSNQGVLKPFVELRYKLATNITIATAPLPGWTEKIFPDLSSEEGTARFWETLFDICRVNEKDPVKAWEDHFEDLDRRRQTLNQKGYAGLNLSGPGTDLKLGLPRGHIWQAAQFTCQAGFSFSANIPTEEVFTLPHKDQTEGVVSITKPICIAGGIIEGAVLTFSRGKVIKASAKKGEENLHKLLEADPGHRQLGEIALVPHSSPISQSGLIFYTILIDENASSHMALGSAIRASLEEGVSMPDEEFSAAGGNLSTGHLDVMIGSGEIDVDGVLPDGTSEPLMRGGEWAYDA